MAAEIDMLTLEELTELVALRTQMDTLQQRYNALTAKLRQSGTTMPDYSSDTQPSPIVPATVAPAATAPAPVNPAPLPVTPAAPAPIPVAPVAAPPRPVAPAAAAPAPVAPAPIATVIPRPSASQPPLAARPLPTPAAAVPAVPVEKRTITERCIAILTSVENGLTFEKIYAKLGTDGHPLPPERPKLKVRAILQKKSDIFSVEKGTYALH